MGKPGGWICMMTNRPHGVLCAGVTAQQFGRIDEAVAAEKRLKRWRREWKIRMAEETNPQWADLFEMEFAHPPSSRSPGEPGQVFPSGLANLGIRDPAAEADGGRGISRTARFASGIKDPGKAASGMTVLISARTTPQADLSVPGH